MGKPEGVPGGRGPYRRSRQRGRILELLQSTGWVYDRLRREFPNLDGFELFVDNKNHSE